MPELPEAEITRRAAASLIGKRMRGFWSDWKRGLRITSNPADISRDIEKRRVLSVWRKGKVIFFTLGEKGVYADKPTRILAFHQRMSGSLAIVAKTGARQGDADNKHLHAKVYFDDGTELWFHDPRKFGVIWYGEPEKVMRDPYLASLGPDALAISYQEFIERLRERKGTIKPLLLRQDIIAGIGNYLADEILWQAKIHPQTLSTVMKNSQYKKLFLAMEETLNKAIHAAGTTLRYWQSPDGTPGNFADAMHIYGKAGERCSRCKTEIQRIVVGSRGTWICEKCQKKYAVTPRDQTK